MRGAATTIPAPVVDDLVASASPLWLASAPPSLLAQDLALCHPELRAGEVRAVANPLRNGLTRLTVVTHDRVGLLADTAAVLANEGVSVLAASAATWPAAGSALHSLTVRTGDGVQDRWERIGAGLRTMVSGAAPSVAFTPTGRATTSWSALPDGRRELAVDADDRVGLLWAICRWLADHELSIEAAHVDAVGDRASDRFVVVGAGEPDGLRAAISAPSSTHRAQALAAVARTARGLRRRAGRPPTS